MNSSHHQSPANYNNHDGNFKSTQLITNQITVDKPILYNFKTTSVGEENYCTNVYISSATGTNFIIDGLSPWLNTTFNFGLVGSQDSYITSDNILGTEVVVGQYIRVEGTDNGNDGLYEISAIVAGKIDVAGNNTPPTIQPIVVGTSLNYEKVDANVKTACRIEIVTLRIPGIRLDVGGGGMLAGNHTNYNLDLTSTPDNVIFGDSGGSQTTGNNNLIFGNGNIPLETNISQVICLGHNNIPLATGDTVRTVICGNGNFGGEIGRNNVGFGHDICGGATTAGLTRTTAVGNEALNMCTDSIGNTALGFQAASNLVDGGRNVVLGELSRTGATDSWNTVVIGSQVTGVAFDHSVTMKTCRNIVGTGIVLHQDSTGELIRFASSSRFKVDIKPHVFDTDFILSGLNPVSFCAKDGHQMSSRGPGHERDRYIGLIAEDVYEIMPEIVSLDKDDLPEGINYKMLVLPLLQCVKELNARILRLEEAHK